MKKKTRFYKLLAMVLAIAMVLSIVEGLTLIGSAASISKSYNYRIKVKNSGDRKSGTDSDVYCIVKTHSGARYQAKIDSKANDFEKNDCREYTVNVEAQPWEISEVGLRCGGRDGMKIAWFEWKLPNGSVVRKDINAWFENQKGKTAERTYSVMSGVDRQISARGDFDSNFSGSKYYSPATTTGQSDIVMSWNGKVTDQYFSNYNMLDYFGAVGVEFSPKAKSYGYSGITSINGLTNNNLAKVDTTQGFDTKITLYTNKLLEYMDRNDIYKLEMQSTLDYIWETDEYGYYSENFTLVRTGFKLESATVTTAAYTPRKDNNFFNSDSKYNTFEIKIPVKEMDNYNASTIASGLVSNINSNTSKAKIYYDKKETGKYVTPEKVYSRDRHIYLVCKTPADYPNMEGVGLTVAIENAKATYNGKTYTLHNKNSKSTDYEYYISTHKVDTQGLTHIVNDEHGEKVDASKGFDTYKKEHKFQLAFSEKDNDVYIDDNKGGRTQGNFSYRLYSKDGKSEIGLAKHNGLVVTSNVPHTGGTNYKISPEENVEGEYKLVISTKDLANNLSTTNLPVKIDNLAPRATYTLKEVSPVDLSKRYEFTFNISDKTETGKLHYAFVREGQSIPDTDNKKPDSSGPEETIYEKWGFINQANSDAQTVVLNIAEGGYFKGRLYWYTTDEAGNDSRSESNSGTDANGYYYKDILLDNEKTDCQIEISDSTPGKPEYDISFETNAANKVEYRWISNSLTTPYITYTGKDRPGNAVQKNGSGDNVTLNGDYILEYVVTTAAGKKETFTKEFVFDNNAPSIVFESTDQSISDTKNINIITKDISNIKTIKYQLLKANGDAVGEELELPAGLPVVSNEVVLAPETTGAYKIKVTATDVNGQSATEESFIFSTRNKAPNLYVSNNISRKIGETPVTNSQEYSIEIRVKEDIENIEKFDKDQILQYRISSDGENYSEWKIETDVEYWSSGIFGEIDVDSPVVLNNGDNRVYVQAMFTQKGADASKIRNEFVATNSETIIIYDTEAPQYKIEIDDAEMTNSKVSGTLSVTDNYTPAEEIYLVSFPYSVMNMTQSSMSEIAVNYDLEITENIADDAIVVQDNAGNKAEIPVLVNCIDKEPPKVKAEKSEKIDSGERKDFYLSFWIDEAMEEKTSFALIECEDYEVAPEPTWGSTSVPSIDEAPVVDPERIEDELFGPLPENIRVINQETEYNYENGETKTYYELQVYADEEKIPENPDGATFWEEYYELNNNNYMLVAKSEDILGNSSKQSIGFGMTLVNKTAGVSYLECIPEKAGSKSVVYMDMTVPVYLMPPGSIEIPDAVKQHEDGRLDNSGNETIENFVEQIANQADEYMLTASFVVDKHGEHTVYFVDECGRTYKQTINIKELSHKDTDSDDDVLSAYVDFGTPAPVTAKLYRTDYENRDNPALWEEITDAENLEAIDLYDAYTYYVVIEGNDDTVGLFDCYNSGDSDNDDFYLIEQLSEYHSDIWRYKKVVYQISQTLSRNRYISCCVGYTNEGVEEISGYVYELNLKDVTPPLIEAHYSTKGHTKDDVIVTVTAADPELSTQTDEGDKNPAGSDPTAGDAVDTKTFTDAETAKAAGIAKLEISQISESFIDDYTTLDYTDLGQVSNADITFDKNGYAAARVTNTLGLVNYVDIEVQNINKNVLEKGVHYNVNYYYINNEGNEVLCTEGDYYREVIARVEITDAGIERELEITNNAGSGEKMLSNFDDSFVFNLKDMYGHIKKVEVSHSRFDNAGPMAEFVLIDKAKTNQPVRVELKATDMLSTAAEVSLTDSEGNDIPVTFSEDIIDTGTNLVTKVFTATINDSGFYKMTAKDILGNVTYKNFAVTNIDRTAPVVVEKKYTSIEDTRQAVGVKLYYSEPDVVITRVELNETSFFTEDDLMVDYNNSVLRFDVNGTVSVWYADEYGNECQEACVVAVGNINRTVPSVGATTTLSADNLSVDVDFSKNADEKRDASKLYVMYGGTAPVIEEDGEERVASLADGVKFTFVENGTYTFYIYDTIGNIQELPVEITGIDRKAPEITQVSWSYKYMDASGNEVVVEKSLVPGTEVGYSIVEDAENKATNQDITATVITDDPTKFAGSSSEEYSTEHSIVYDEDGWFNFDLVKPNTLMDSYGLGLYLIDKEPPVIEDVEDLIFFENPNAGTRYDKNLLTYSAYDERYGEKTDLTSKVEIDWGGFNPDNIAANRFDKNNPYTITYTVKDAVGNETSVKRTITLVGLFDTMVRVNGKYPDSSGRVEVLGNSIEISLDNFGGTAYARYEKGMYTMGEMKHLGTVIAPTGDKFKLDKLSEGWYTLYVQTDLKDYFCVNVYIYNK